MNTIQIFKGKSSWQPWWWRVVSVNGQIVATSGEGYFSKWNAKRAAKKLYPDIPILIVR